jgi:hypothetical protein
MDQEYYLVSVTEMTYYILLSNLQIIRCFSRDSIDPHRNRVFFFIYRYRSSMVTGRSLVLLKCIGPFFLYSLHYPAKLKCPIFLKIYTKRQVNMPFRFLSVDQARRDCFKTKKQTCMPHKIGSPSNRQK